jgi:hypothetical protein
MSKLCKCTAGGKNLGKSPCDPILLSVNRILFKERANADGSIPKIDFSGSPFTESNWNNLIKATPMRNRYLLGIAVDDYEFEEQEAETVESANGIERTIRDGFVQVSYNIYDATFKLYERFKALECLSLGVHLIDDAGQVAGMETADADKLGLVPIDSFRVRKAATQNSGVVAHLIVTFRIPHTVNLGSIRIWKPEGADFNPLDLLPISDLEVTDLAATDSSAIVTFKVGNKSTLFGFDAFVGLTKDNVTITVDGVAATIDDLEETAQGTYSAELSAAVSSAEVVAVTEIDVNGFELTEIASVTVA